MDRPQKFSQLRSAMRKLPGPIVSGKVTTVGGLGLVASGLGESAKIGDRACVAGRIPAEVVATSPEGVRLLPFGTWDGIGRGDPSRDPSKELWEVLRRAIDEHEDENEDHHRHRDDDGAGAAHLPLRAPPAHGGGRLRGCPPPGA